MGPLFGLEADVALELSPEGGFPTVYFQLFGVQDSNRHCCRGQHCVVGRIVGPQFHFLTPAVGRVGQSVDGQAEIRQHIIVNNVIKEYGVRIEGFLVQNDTIGEYLFVTDGFALPESEGNFKRPRNRVL